MKRILHYYRLNFFLYLVSFTWISFFSAYAQYTDSATYSFAQEQFLEGSANGDYSLVTAAIQKFQIALQSNPQNFDVLLRLAQSYYMIGNFVLADEYVKKAAQIEEDSLPLKILSLEIETQLGRLEQSKAIIQELDSLIPNNPHFLFAKLKYNASVGDIHALEINLDTLAVVLQDKDFYNTIFSLVFALSENQFSVEDKALLAELQNFDISSNSWIEWIVGDYYFFSGERKRAQSYYRQIIAKRLPSVIPNAYEKLIAISREYDDYSQTRALAQKYVADFPLLESARLLLAELYMGMGDYKTAVDGLEDARSLILDSEILSFAYDVVLREYVQSLGEVSLEVQAKVDNRVQELLFDATQYLKSGKETQAEILARRAYYINPEHLDVLSFLAEFYRIQERLTLSQRYFLQLRESIETQTNASQDTPKVSNTTSISSIDNGGIANEGDFQAYLNRIESLSYEYDNYLTEVELDPQLVIKHKYRYKWPLRIRVNVDHETSAYTTFVQRMLQFYLEQYPHLTIEHDSATIPTHPVQIEVNFRDFDKIFELSFVIANSNSNEILLQSNQMAYGNMRFYEALRELARRTSVVLPRVANLVPRDNRSFFAFLGTDDGLTLESRALFVDNGSLSLISSPPYFVLSNDESDIEISPTLIKDSVSIFSISENNASESIKLSQNMGQDDFVLFISPDARVSSDTNVRVSDVFADYIQRMRLPLW